MIRRVPVGVIGAITPWNSPSVLGMRVVAPALALGNAVVLKPDPQTPVCGGAVFAAVFREAGLPEGLLQIVIGDAEAGQALVTDPNIDMVSFTGSTEVGRLVGALAGGLLKKVSLELGGNNALVVLDDADVAAAASAGAYASFQFQGQVCFATGRHIVQRSVADEYIELLAQQGQAACARAIRFATTSTWGQSSTRTQLQRVNDIVQRSIAKRWRAPRRRAGRTTASSIGRPSWSTCASTRRRGPTRSSARSRQWSRSPRTTRRSNWPIRPNTASPRASTRARSRAAWPSPTGSGRACSTSTTRRSTTRRPSRSAGWACRATDRVSAARPTSRRSRNGSG